MRVTKKRGLIALASAVVVAAAVAIPTVIASSNAAGPGGAVTSAGPSAAATGTVSCANTKMKSAWNDALASGETSTSYVLVPGMTVEFDSLASCAEITFSAWPYAPGTQIMFVRALIDGTICQAGNSGYQSGGVQFATGDGTYADTHSYTFVCTGFSALHNHHTATVEYKSYSGGSVYMHEPTMVVRYG